MSSAPCKSQHRQDEEADNQHRGGSGLPIGHGKHHATVPLGALATLDADAGTLVVEEVVTADP